MNAYSGSKSARLLVCLTLVVDWFVYKPTNQITIKSNHWWVVTSLVVCVDRKWMTSIWSSLCLIPFNVALTLSPDTDWWDKFSTIILHGSSVGSLNFVHFCQCSTKPRKTMQSNYQQNMSQLMQPRSHVRLVLSITSPVPIYTWTSDIWRILRTDAFNVTRYVLKVVVQATCNPSGKESSHWYLFNT